MKRILFQGDSITDCGRVKEVNSVWASLMQYGNGYPVRVAGALGYEKPGEYEFLNRAVSGNRIVDLYARIKCDIINLKPDYLSILVGVNDVWHELGYNNGVDAEKFEKIYDLLISEIKIALPDIKIMLLGAFVLKSTETEQNWNVFSSEVPKMAAATKRIAEKYGCTYVPLQEKFDEAVKRHAEPYWTAEGVHPMPAGHELIAKEWLKAFDQMSK